MEELSLKWDEHHPAVISVFEELLAKGTLVDCTIAADGQYVKAHKVVLAACSPYFELLFSQENEKNPIVVLKDMKFQELKYLIDFVYRGQVKLPEDQLDAFVSAAESLQIKGLSGQQKKQISEKSANKTVASREGCSSPIPRKRRRSSRTEPNEDSRSEPGNDSSTDSNIHENFMPTPVSLGAPSTSAASSSSGIASHSVTTQRRQGLPESRFPSHNRPSASPEQVLPDVSTVVKTEPIEEPTEPVEEVFLSEPKNEEYVDDLAMLESGAGSSDTRGGTSQQNTNNYPGYDSTGDTFMMNQMANQNSGPGAASSGRLKVVAASAASDVVPPSPRRLTGMACARVTAGSARTARQFAEARARRQQQQLRRQKHQPSTTTTTTTSTAAAATAEQRDETRSKKLAKTSPQGAPAASPTTGRRAERLPNIWSPVVVLHDIAKSHPAAAPAKPSEVKDATPRVPREDADSATGSVVSVAGSSEEEETPPSSVGRVEADVDCAEVSSGPDDQSSTDDASATSESALSEVTVVEEVEMIEEVSPMSAVAPVTPPTPAAAPPRAASSRMSPAARRCAASASPASEAASLPPAGDTSSLDTSLDDDRPLVRRWKGAGSRERKSEAAKASGGAGASRGQSPRPSQPKRTRSRTPGKVSALTTARAPSPPRPALSVRARRRSAANADEEADPSSRKSKTVRKQTHRRSEVVMSKDSGINPDASKVGGSAPLTAADARVSGDPPLSQRRKSRAQSAPPQETTTGSKKASRKSSRGKSEAATSGHGTSTSSTAAHVSELPNAQLVLERFDSRSQSAPPHEASEGSKKAPLKGSRRKSETVTSVDAAVGDGVSTPSTADNASKKSTSRPSSDHSNSRTQTAPPQETSTGKARKKTRKKSETATAIDADPTVSATGVGALTPSSVADAAKVSRPQPPSERGESLSQSAPPQETAVEIKKSARKRTRGKLETVTTLDDDAATNVGGDVVSTGADVNEVSNSQPPSEHARSHPAPPQETSTGKAPRKKSRKKSEAATTSTDADCAPSATSDDASMSSTVTDASELSKAQSLSEQSDSRSHSAPPQEMSAGKGPLKKSRKKSEVATTSSKDADSAPSATSNEASLSTVADASELSERSESLPETGIPQETTAGKASFKKSRKRSEAVATSRDAGSAPNTSDDASMPFTDADASELSKLQSLSEKSDSRSHSAPPEEMSAGKGPLKKSRKKSEAATTSSDAGPASNSTRDDAALPSTVAVASELSSLQPLSERSESVSHSALPQETSAEKAALKKSRKKSEVTMTSIESATDAASDDAPIPSTVTDASEVSSARPPFEDSETQSQTAPPLETSAGKAPRKKPHKSEALSSDAEAADPDPTKIVASSPVLEADDVAESSDKSDDEPLSRRVSLESTPLRETPVASPVSIDLESSPSPTENSPPSPACSPPFDPVVSDMDYLSAVDGDDALFEPVATPRTDASGRSSAMSDYSTASLWTETCASPPRDAAGRYMYSPLDDDAPVVIKRKTRRKSGQYVYTLVDDEDDEDMPSVTRESPERSIEPPATERWWRSRSATPVAEQRHRSPAAGRRASKTPPRRRKVSGWLSADELSLTGAKPSRGRRHASRPRGRPRKPRSRGSSAASSRRSATPAKDDLLEMGSALDAAARPAPMAEHFPTSRACETCGSMLHSAAGLRRHMLDKHPLSAMADSMRKAAAEEEEEEKKRQQKRRFHCRVCGRPFIYESSLRSHEQGLHQRTHKCDSCGERFFTSDDLRTHRAFAHAGVGAESEPPLAAKAPRPRKKAEETATAQLPD